MSHLKEKVQKSPANVDQIRNKTIKLIKNSVTPAQWQANEQLVTELKAQIRHSPLLSHPILTSLYTGSVSLHSLTRIHLEYRHAIVQIFTDALVMAVFQARQLEPTLVAGNKLHPRFLLTLNILDEFGFKPGIDAHGYYCGSSNCAHYPLYQEVLMQLGLSDLAQRNYRPSVAADYVRRLLECAYEDYPALLCLLAVAEEQVIAFSPALRAGLQHHGIDVSSGYYHVHGTTQDRELNAADDDHANDLWICLGQSEAAATPTRIVQVAEDYLTAWIGFWDHQYAQLPQHERDSGDTEHSLQSASA